MAETFVRGTISPFLPLTAEQVEAMSLLFGDSLDDEVEPDETPGETLAREWVEKYGLEFGLKLDCELVSDGTYYLFAEDGLEDGAELVLQEILSGLPEEYTHVCYEGSTSCSKMRPGEFGGVSCFITRDKVEFFSTSGWIYSKIQSLTD
jgi:hypothetical protein